MPRRFLKNPFGVTYAAHTMDYDRTHIPTFPMDEAGASDDGQRKGHGPRVVGPCRSHRRRRVTRRGAGQRVTQHRVSYNDTGFGGSKEPFAAEAGQKRVGVCSVRGWGSVHPNQPSSLSSSSSRGAAHSFPGPPMQTDIGGPGSPRSVTNHAPPKCNWGGEGPLHIDMRCEEMWTHRRWNSKVHAPKRYSR
jgi:hypothetical protein